MLPLAEVMDKVPPYGDVVLTSVALALLVVAAATWRPWLGLVVVLAAHFIPWFRPASWAVYESFDPFAGEALRNEDPSYFGLARSIPWLLSAALAVGTSIWFFRKRRSAIVGRTCSNG